MEGSTSCTIQDLSSVMRGNRKNIKPSKEEDESYEYSDVSEETIAKPDFVDCNPTVSTDPVISLLYFTLIPDPGGETEEEIWSTKRVLDWRPCKWWLQGHFT
ncbi:hypothetical protein Tco_1097050, partial [Tanacetum coccineum]